MRREAILIATVQPIRSLADWQALIQSPEPVLIFKHSTACPVSRHAQQQFYAFAGALPAGPLRLAEVRVIEERPVSQQIAYQTGVLHQSPQVLLLHHGRVAWHASHSYITTQALAQAARANGLF